MEIIARTPAMLEVLEKARKVATSDVSIVIYGESGTGKEVLARYIYENSRRSDKRFVEVNCSTISSDLLESEFFGHKRGAFTDAYEDYQGKIGFSNGGTLFLDEIEEMDLAVQAKLLRFLQSGVYFMLGSSEEMSSDVRIISATNRKLGDLISAGKIRNDLFYRLNVVTLEIPPLRERISDIPYFIDYFLKSFNTQYNKNITCGNEGYSLASLYKWPGNVRELKNAIERFVVMSSGIGFDAGLFAEIIPYGKKDDIKELKDAVNDFKRDYIIEALDFCGWNQTKTAEVLGIQRTYLSRLIKELNIDKI